MQGNLDEVQTPCHEGPNSWGGACCSLCPVNLDALSQNSRLSSGLYHSPKILAVNPDISIEGSVKRPGISRVRCPLSMSVLAATIAKALNGSQSGD